MSKKQLLEKELVEGMTYHTAHADELAVVPLEELGCERDVTGKQTGKEMESKASAIFQRSIKIKINSCTPRSGRTTKTIIVFIKEKCTEVECQ